MSELKAWVLVATLTILLVMISWVVSAHFETRAYERVTGKHVSMWDALFLELRVQND